MQAKRKKCLPARTEVVVLLGLLMAWVATVHAEGRPERPPSEKRVSSAIEGGLKWLAEQQVTEGSNAGCWRADSSNYRVAVTSLAGLAFLANGHTPNKQGPYAERVRLALDFVMDSMDDRGYLGGGDPSGMYIHALGSLFGLSCLGMYDDPEREVELVRWCRAALKVILEAQKVQRPPVAAGGWRYTPQSPESDVSVTSWQLVVLHTARQCGYRIDQGAFDAGLKYIRSAFMRTDESEETSLPRGGFVYRPGISTRPEPSDTGVALFIKSLLQKRRDEQTTMALRYLEDFDPSWGGPLYGGYFYFSLFYIAQGMFQLGGDTWAEFFPRMQRVLLKHQAGDGHWPFPPDNAHPTLLAGEAYSTAMAVLVLSLEKQFLPMYQRQRRLFSRDGALPSAPKQYTP
jgi:hypothetical protein